jgi:hypothetical protein
VKCCAGKLDSTVSSGERKDEEWEARKRSWKESTQGRESLSAIVQAHNENKKKE